MKTTKHLNQDTFFQRVIAILVIVLLLTSILCINIKAINQRWHFTFDNIGFDLEASGWYAAYGGNISVTNEEYHSGNYSLKMTNRTKAWQSPALNLDRIFYEGGPGIYVFTVCGNTPEVLFADRNLLLLYKNMMKIILERLHW